jgi:hypothetical protein
VVREDVVTADVLLIGDAGEYVDENSTVFVGSEADPAALEKTQLIPIQSFRPIDEHQVYDSLVTFLQPGEVNNQLFVEYGLVLSPGCTLTEVSLSAFRETTSDQVALFVHRVDAEGNGTLLGDDSHGSTGWEEVTVALDEEIDPDEHYVLRVSLSADAGGDPFDARASRVKVTYDMPDYAKSL